MQMPNYLSSSCSCLRASHCCILFRALAAYIDSRMESDDQRWGSTRSTWARFACCWGQKLSQTWPVPCAICRQATETPSPSAETTCATMYMLSRKPVGLYSTTLFAPRRASIVFGQSVHRLKQGGSLLPMPPLGGIHVVHSLGLSSLLAASGIQLAGSCFLQRTSLFGGVALNFSTGFHGVLSHVSSQQCLGLGRALVTAGLVQSPLHFVFALRVRLLTGMSSFLCVPMVDRLLFLKLPNVRCRCAQVREHLLQVRARKPGEGIGA